VMCEYSKFRIESNSYLLFDSKLTQLFEIFEYLFNRDQSGVHAPSARSGPGLDRGI